MRSLDMVFAGLARSPFRQKFRLRPRDFEDLTRIGMAHIEHHARLFVHDRLAPAQPRNEGRQTPMRGHPVFSAQHATATCCRKCLASWHDIPAGRGLTAAEEEHAVRAIMRWIAQQRPAAAPVPKRRSKDPQLSFPFD